MVLNGVRVYNDGVEIGHESQERIRQIVDVIKTLSPSSEVSVRLLKSGRIYEGLLWGKANNVPIGAYNRGPSVSLVLEALCRQVKKQCLKVWKFHQSGTKATRDQTTIAMVG